MHFIFKSAETLRDRRPFYLNMQVEKTEAQLLAENHIAGCKILDSRNLELPPAIPFAWYVMEPMMVNEGE